MITSQVVAAMSAWLKCCDKSGQRRGAMDYTHSEDGRRLGSSAGLWLTEEMACRVGECEGQKRKERVGMGEDNLKVYKMVITRQWQGGGTWHSASRTVSDGAIVSGWGVMIVST